MDTIHIINIQERMEEIFGSEKWKNSINIEKKEKIITTLFYKENWNKILPENRIYLLQELENIEAEKQKRSPYKFVLVGEKSKYFKKMFDLLLVHNIKTIYIKKELIQNGLKQKIINEKETMEDINSMLNAYLLSSVYHEQFHIQTELNIATHLKNFKTFIQTEATIEEKEHIIWLLTRVELENIKSSKTVLELVRNYYTYRMIPGEYYAFEYEKEKTKQTFGKIQEELGIDLSFKEYMKHEKQQEKQVEESYFVYTGERLEYQQIYKKEIKKVIEEMAYQRGVTIETLLEEYCMPKERYIQKENNKVQER